MPEYLTAVEAAAVMRTRDVTAVVAACRDGRLEASDPFGQWLITPAAITEFVARSNNEDAL